MKNDSIQVVMLKKVAEALGPDLCDKMVFVGGCTTGLLLTDSVTLEEVRHTDDVDLIVNVFGYNGYATLQQELRERGFKNEIPSDDDHEPICAMKIGDMRVDFMPDDEEVLGFSNCWYKDALATAEYRSLGEIKIKLVSPVHFLTTKLEAYKGRGNGDALSSRDIEDILLLVDGREELIYEVKSAPQNIQIYIAEQISKLLKDSNFEYAVQSQSKRSIEREKIIFERLGKLAAGE